MDISKGRYWDKTWSLISGCTPCSPGCDHCWSESMTRRFDGKRDTGLFLTNEDTGKFNGHIITHPERLDIPLKRKKPTVYAVWNDWCHENVTDGFRREILSTARQCPQHTILALTKRVEVLVAFTRWMEIHTAPFSWPANWWNILTICNQEEANQKLPAFLQILGLKGLSIEPMLGAVDLADLGGPAKAGGSHGWSCLWDTPLRSRIDAVILGGETGPGARPMHPDWVRSVRDQCATAGVPFFFKGWGEWLPLKQMGYVVPDNACNNSVFMDPLTLVCRVGRKKAGRILDGRTHNELPWRAK